jgi:zinc protease
LGDLDSMQRIGATDVAAFHHTLYAPANSYLVVVGSFDAAAAVDLLGSFELPTTLLPLPPLPVACGPAAEPDADVTLVDVPHAQQIELRVGHAGVKRDSDDLPSLEVLNTILGRGPSSRLARTLRQRQGLTYHVRSYFEARRNRGPFVVETSVASEAAGAALMGIHREIATLCETLVPEAEVEQAKRSLLGAELQRFQSIRGLGITLGPAALDGDPLRQFEHRRRGIAAVEPDGLREVARRHLHPERLVTVAAGPIAALDSQFSGCGGYERHPRVLETTS